ncbi:PAC2 family protein [Dermatobacter hominis]|uniref:PAC2 family protein n=1 Tax=Dermatobacter hominis TaxID=2884263 RepID=UPI001D129A99|nr:PAC2 family protein [Dermatobacter hominis]UDY34602.1 PAC2 family protein [Dermatobacter hominis]
MGNLEWLDGPAARRREAGSSAEGPGPVLVAAFEGWNDAGDAATGAVEHLWERWGATTIASIDPEEFYDFTATRPHARREAGRRVIDWPANEFGWAEPDGTNGVVLLRGVEPQLRWRTFCGTVLEVADELGCEWVLTIGALLADVPHTRPTPVFGTAEDPGLGGRLGLGPSEYEGPTGILGALQGECGARGLPAASLWAAVPSYAPSAPSPKAAVTLAARAVTLLGTTVDTSVLDLASLSYERQLDELVAEDDTTLEYVHLLERQHDASERATDDGVVPNADQLLDEVERFLREQ